jgi:hypothetical protein
MSLLNMSTFHMLAFHTVQRARMTLLLWGMTIQRSVFATRGLVICATQHTGVESSDESHQPSTDPVASFSQCDSGSKETIRSSSNNG